MKIPTYLVDLLTPYKRLTFFDEYFQIIKQLDANPTSNKKVLMNFFFWIIKIFHMITHFLCNGQSEIVQCIIMNYFYVLQVPDTIIYLFVILQASSLYYSYIMFFKVHRNSFTTTPCQFLGLSKMNHIFSHNLMFKNSPKLNVKRIRKIVLTITNAIQSSISPSSE